MTVFKVLHSRLWQWQHGKNGHTVEPKLHLSQAFYMLSLCHTIRWLGRLHHSAFGSPTSAVIIMYVLIALPMTQCEFMTILWLPGGHVSATCLKMLVMCFADVQWHAPLSLHSMFEGHYKGHVIVILWFMEVILMKDMATILIVIGITTSESTLSLYMYDLHNFFLHFVQRTECCKYYIAVVTSQLS